MPRLYTWVKNKYFVDEAYEWLFIDRLVKRGGKFLWEVDARVIDGFFVNGARNLTIFLSNVSSWFDLRYVDGLVNGVGEIFQRAWRGYRRVQNGRTQSYAMTMAAGIFGFVCLYILLS